MANISAIKLPDGNTYTIKDSVSGYTTNTGTVTSVAAGMGLITNQTNNAAITSSGTIKANLNSETSLGTIGTTTKLYAVGVDDNGQLCVDVPWENSDTKVTSSVKTTGGTIYLVGSSNSATITSTLSKHASLSATFSTDTSTDGYTRLTLGNSKTSSTEGGKKGILRLYGTGSGRIDLTVAAANNYTITLPNKEGTIALTTDIPSSSSTPTADIIAEFDSNAHMNSTDMTTQALETYVDSLDIQGSVFVDATDVPTAGEIAKFDSTANMSSTDMTTGSGGEVEAFVNGLNVSGAGGQTQTRKLLWTNTTATASFATQTISLDLSDYDHVEVWFFPKNETDAFFPNPVMCRTGESAWGVLLHNIYGAGVNENTGARKVAASSTGVAFGNYVYKNRRSGGSLTTDNSFAIPQYIYGIKYV